jgi:hypothetical protein
MSRLVSSLVLGAGLIIACQSSKESQRLTVVSAASSTPAPVDRLAKDELAASSTLAFGFPIPESMHVRRAFSDSIYLDGSVTTESLLSYIRKHAEIGSLELGRPRTVVNGVRITGGDATKVYRIEIVERRPLARMVLRDVTPRTDTSTLSEEERWRRAGLRPNGEPLDKNQLR